MELPKVVRVPDGTDQEYLTDGEDYEVVDVKKVIRGNCLFTIVCDDGEEADCSLFVCLHLNLKNWIVIK